MPDPFALSALDGVGAGLLHRKEMAQGKNFRIRIADNEAVDGFA